VSGVLRTAACRLALTAMLAMPSGADAQTTAFAAGQGSPNQIALQVQVLASVGGRCGFSATGVPNGSFDQPNFDVNGFTHDFPFQLECTGPSRVAVVSSNGGLLTSGTVPVGYAAKAPYDVLLNLVGANSTVNATCAAASLAAGGSCPFRGPATAGQGLRLAASSINQVGTFLRVSAPTYAAPDVLAAGNYADTLIVTVSVAP
jgi:hypothetical protein